MLDGFDCSAFTVCVCAHLHRCHYLCPTFCPHAVRKRLLQLLLLLKEALSDNGGQMPGEQQTPDKILSQV